MDAPLSIGDIRVRFVSGGKLWIDGGNMFGVIPRLMWERESPPDAQHRIRLETNCALVQTPDSLGLIDTGYGGKTASKFRQRHSLEDGEPLVRNLKSAGISPEQIDWVVLTHLHFDHAGGATVHEEGGVVRPTFPRARYFVQRAEWEDATGNKPELAGAYYVDDIMPIERNGQLKVVEGNAEVVPGVHVQLTAGHTRGHQIVKIESSGESGVCLADMCPTTAHLRTFWTMAYDQFPLDIRRKKPAIMNDIVDNHRLALFSHDPDIVAARLVRESANEWRTAPM
jgi:glyoxylase-like metal-dependent hydrolase (beta-lactamase superfamily II)